MQYAIIADIHANMPAFTAVLNDARQHGGFEELWCLGDVVGYGPDPGECISLLKEYKHLCVAGNHDWAAIGKIDTNDFNHDAAAAAHWTAKQLSPSDREYLESLPLTIEHGDFTLAHGSPSDPIWEYIFSTGIARENLDHFKTRYCLVGHTHVPAIFRDENGVCSASELAPDIKLVLGKDRLIINPGGVGQPRDGDPRASYAIYDSETKTVRLFRVSYDIKATQKKMAENGLPPFLISRLSSGI